MSTDDYTKSKIINFAKNDKRVKSVILNGSRANRNVIPDQYQDFDILFLVDNFQSFLKDKSWISFLGKPILQQLPDEMILGSGDNAGKFSYTWLMIFENGVRIDLTLFPIEKFNELKVDSLSVIWLDKENRFDNFSEPGDYDYHVKKPTEREFLEVSNEFWWCSTNVAKGLARKEILYAKDMMETVVRPMFMKIIEWEIGYENNFEVSVGKSGKFIPKFIDADLYNKILATYSDATLENNWEALSKMTSVFRNLQQDISKKLNFKINTEEAVNAIRYIKKLKKGG